MTNTTNEPTREEKEQYLNHTGGIVAVQKWLYPTPNTPTGNYTPENMKDVLYYLTKTT